MAMKAWIVLVLLAAVAGAEQVEKGKVIVLTDANYDTFTASGVWLVKFYAPWCGHCSAPLPTHTLSSPLFSRFKTNDTFFFKQTTERLAPTWEELAKVVDGAFNVAELDCTVNTAVAQKMGIRGYPTIKLLEPGHDAVDARVPRTVSSFIDFVVNNAKTVDLKGKIAKPPEDPKIVDEKPKPQPPPKKEEEDEPAPADSDVLVLTEANIDAETAKGPMLIKFYAPWCGHCSAYPS